MICNCSIHQEHGGDTFTSIKRGKSGIKKRFILDF